MKIYLIGMPGCGKTKLGRLLATKLNLPFYDLDEEIIDNTGKPINAIFEQHGEEFFRLREAELLKVISDTQPDFVLATGGGAPCFHGNIDYMNNMGVTVFLNVPIEQIYAKLNQRGTLSRPLLRQLDDQALLDELKAKFKDRIGYYRQADILINSGFDEDVQLRVEEIERALKKLEK